MKEKTSDKNKRLIINLRAKQDQEYIKRAIQKNKSIKDKKTNRANNIIANATYGIPGIKELNL